MSSNLFRFSWMPKTSLCHQKRFDWNRVLHYTIATKEWRIQIKWHIPRQLSYDKKCKIVSLSAWFKLEHIQWFEEQPKNPWEPIIKLRFRGHGGHNISTSRNFKLHRIWWMKRSCLLTIQQIKNHQHAMHGSNLAITNELQRLMS